MKQAAEFFSLLQRETLLSVATCAPGKVLKYNESLSQATIQPLFLTADKEDNLFKQSIIEDCLVLKHCKADVKIGSVVFYQVVQRSLDNLNGANLIDPDSYDLLSSNDAVVLGVLE